MSRIRLGRWARGNSPRRARCPQRVLSGGTPPPPADFGTECHYVETSAQTITNGTTFLTHLSLVTSALTGGDYWVFFKACYQQDANSGGQCRVRFFQQPGTTLFEEDAETEGQNTNPDDPVGEFDFARVLTLASGIHTFNIDIARADAPVDDVALYWSAIELWAY